MDSDYFRPVPHLSMPPRHPSASSSLPQSALLPPETAVLVQTRHSIKRCQNILLSFSEVFLVKPSWHGVDLVSSLFFLFSTAYRQSSGSSGKQCNTRTQRERERGRDERNKMAGHKRLREKSESCYQKAKKRPLFSSLPLPRVPRRPPSCWCGLSSVICLVGSCPLWNRCLFATTIKNPKFHLCFVLSSGRDGSHVKLQREGRGRVGSARVLTC